MEVGKQWEKAYGKINLFKGSLNGVGYLHAI
jgi:hypothetical protein